MAAGGNKQLIEQSTGILPKNAFVVIVRTAWNASIVDALEAGCVKVLRANGVNLLKTITVPGAFEIPFAIKNYRVEAKQQPHAFIALGCVIRGDTPHFDYICRAVTDGVLQLNLQLSVPVIFGVLTVNTIQQAEERLGGTHGHKGEEAAFTAINMMVLNQGMTAGKSPKP